MQNSYALYLDVPLIQTLEDGSPEIRLRLERAESAKGYSYQANLYEGGRMMLSAGLRYTEPMFFWAYLNHVSAGAIPLPACYAAIADLGIHRTGLNVQAYDSVGRSEYAFIAGCDGGALYLGWGWREDITLPIAVARLDEAGLTGLLRMAQDMIETAL